MLSADDISTYLKAYDEFKDAPKIKNKIERESAKAKALKELRAIYKTVYRLV